MFRFLLGLVSLALLFPGAAFSATAGLADVVSTKSGVTEEQAEAQIRAVFSAIESELHSGREVTIRNFGKFSVKERSPHAARNPRTGETIQVGAKRYPRFRSADGLKERLNTQQQT